MELKVGDEAPVFELPDQDGQMRKLEDYKGKWVLIYFYPKDFTPGCTIEAKALRDSYAQFKDAGISVLGVSADSVESHKSFQHEHNLPFTLLSDVEKTVIERYGARGVKHFAGREFTGTHRISFLVNPEGIIEKFYKKVKPAQHAKEILDDFNALKKSA